MKDYVRRWIQNLVIELLAILAIGVGMLVFMRIFYPDALAMLFLAGEFSVGLTTILKLWPIIILAAIVLPIAYALPRRRRR